MTLSIDPDQYMKKFSRDIVTPEPASISQRIKGVNYGQVLSIKYYSKKAKREKSGIVILPAGYSEKETYPVLYVNHGIFSNANQWITSDLRIQEIAGNLVAKGEAKKMIIVLTNMYTNPKSEFPPKKEYTDEVEKLYDDFLYDISDSLIPYIESKFSVKKGRENRGIAGFSMGGRETLYIGVSRPDLFGYISAACPAPGIFAAKDSFMYHKGSMKKADFKIKDKRYLPYILFITGGESDKVVGSFPYQYYELLRKNGCNCVYQSVPGGKHNGSSVKANLYNFLRYAFKATK